MIKIPPNHNGKHRYFKIIITILNRLWLYQRLRYEWFETNLKNQIERPVDKVTNYEYHTHTRLPGVIDKIVA